MVEAEHHMGGSRSLIGATNRLALPIYMVLLISSKLIKSLLHSVSISFFSHHSFHILKMDIKQNVYIMHEILDLWMLYLLKIFFVTIIIAFFTLKKIES